MTNRTNEALQNFSNTVAAILVDLAQKDRVVCKVLLDSHKELNDALQNEPISEGGGE